jgi:hypothetical protein
MYFKSKAYNFPTHTYVKREDTHALVIRRYTSPSAETGVIKY